MEQNFNFLLIGAATHVGQVRKANEDSKDTFETANMKVFVVCDGMGGHVGGQIASQTAITAIRDFLNNNIAIDPREAIYNSIIEANCAVLNRSRQQPELAGMGSTCVMLVVTSDGKVLYGHVGDSRVYIIANHRIKQLTDDHSEVWEMYQAGIIKSIEDMERHPRKNVITNALGLSKMKPPTICNVPIEPESGNCFLICSDGLTGMVSDEQIQRVVSKHEIPIQQRAEKLVEMANANGGVDNITVILVEFALGTQQLSTGKTPKKSWKKTLFFISTVILLLAGGGAAWRWLHNPVSDNGKDMNTNTIVAEIDTIKMVITDSVHISQDALNVQHSVPKAPEKIEMTFCNAVPVVCNDDSCTDVILSQCKEFEKVKLKTSRLTTSLKDKIIAHIVDKDGTLILRIVCKTGTGFPKNNKVIIYFESKEGTKYEVTFILIPKEIKEEENGEENVEPPKPITT